MVAARIARARTPSSPPRAGGTPRTLPEDLGVGDADEDDLYAAMDWLLERQDAHREEARGAPPARRAAWCSTT